MSKVLRKIISIDERKCDGCGLCVPACEEGALQIVDGKARLVKEIYCDGLGDCLGECPHGAIEIIEREAEPFDREAVEKCREPLNNETIEKEAGKEAFTISPCHSNLEKEIDRRSIDKRSAVTANKQFEPEAELSHWPVQLHLVSPEARFLKDQDLLIAADCVPFAYADFHRHFLAGRSLLIGCPKLDDTGSYHNKLVEIFRNNHLKSITLVHMEVGCCFGLSRLIKAALQEAEAEIPLKEVVVGVDGTIKEEN
ncbi:MAG: 4Fe-4S binding protein [Bacillota bacterium]